MVKDAEREELRRRAALATDLDGERVLVYPGDQTTFILDPPEGTEAAIVLADYKDALTDEFGSDGFRESGLANGSSKVRLVFEGLLR